MKSTATGATLALKNILLATDFSSAATRAMPYALALAKQYGSKLYVAHVIPREVYELAQPQSLDTVLRETRDYAEFKLNHLVDSVRAPRVACQSLVGEGEICDVTAEYVSRLKIDLLVVGTTNRTGLGKLFLGSVAEELIRESRCPVLTVGSHVAPQPPAKFRRILCAIDFSTESCRAATYAFSLAGESDAKLILLHVLEHEPSSSSDLTAQAATQRLLALAGAESVLLYRPEAMIRVGSPGNEILKVASERSADLIVMGVRGAGAFSRAVSHFGSIAHEVITLAPCPVLTARGEPAERAE